MVQVHGTDDREDITVATFKYRHLEVNVGGRGMDLFAYMVLDTIFYSA